MHLLSLLIIALMALTFAQNTCTGDKSLAGHCTILSVTDRTVSSTKASVNTCLDTCRNFLTDAGDWFVDFIGQPEGYIDNISRSTCGFSVGRGEGEPLDYKFYMHNQDIVDIIDEVNTKFGSLHGGKVAGEGTMNCDGHLATWFQPRRIP
ncbi:hypothetical protein P280DRAFT_503402 [Massarina eburnea CBS 473.64]|uniref:Ecp2 effector protein-like domain-containing protein n=1 Tax=Massarina eburnea CBS 473.64 TaxID=1395130 RepID=A0A6A6SHA2_9PLEO|nr:hypothetical protein P280DRAFT_503402 [Massarina eburnea CBS 473.64]